jgi:hypothetical protein
MQKMFIPMLGGYLIFPINTNFKYLKKNQIQRIPNFGYLKTRKELLGFKKEWTKKLAIS